VKSAALVVVLAFACGASAAAAPPSFGRGDLVEARTARGVWVPAYVLSAAGALYRVHYEGSDDRRDETVPAGRVRARATLPRLSTRPPEGLVPPADASVPLPPRRFERGDRVDVFWGEVWWKALVTEVRDGGYRIHYDGWPEDDEILGGDGLARVRPYHSRPPDGPLAAALAALAKKDYATATERFRHALSQSEGEPDAWLGSARTHHALAEDAAALEDLARLLESDPKNTEALALQRECRPKTKPPAG